MLKFCFLITNMFYRFCIIVTLLPQCMSQYPEPTIVKVYKIKEALPYFDEANQNTLVIFDIDSTLTTPSDPCLRRFSIKKHKHVFDRYVGQLTKKQLYIFTHLLILQSPSQLVENEFPEVIMQLQNRGVKTLACTSSSTGSIGNIVKNFSLWRFQELKKLDIDFSSIFPGRVLFPYEDCNDDIPGIEKGIVGCGHKIKKGMLFDKIIAHINFTPHKVIVIDDKMENIESFMNEIRVRYPDVKFIGIQYDGMQLISSVYADESEFKEKIKALADQAVKICDQLPSTPIINQSSR